MGTRGLMAVHVDGQTTGSYNHFDSYPSGLGADIVSFLRTAFIEQAAEQARMLIPVTEDAEPTTEQINRCISLGLCDPSVGDGLDWYSLLRNQQGDMGKTLETGFILDGTSFANDSLFCEWGYVVDFDAGVFEVYRGFQTTPHNEGKFARDEDDRGYYPIRLVASFPLDNIPDDWEKVVEENLDANGH